MKKILPTKTTLIAVSTLLLLNACGGSSSTIKSNTYDDTSYNENIVKDSNTNAITENQIVTDNKPTKNYIPKTDLKPTTNYTTNINSKTNTIKPASFAVNEIGTLEVSDRMLTLNGKGFFWMADTAWMMPARLSKSEIVQYLNNRKIKGFNVIQISASFGDKPFLDEAYQNPNTKLWNKIDYIIDEAAKRNIFIALLPSWNERLYTTTQAQTYGTWIANRYKNKQNIIWVIGGDSNGGEHKALWNTLGTTINSIDKNHLITYHPSGQGSSTDWFKNAPWLDFHMIQSGHSKGNSISRGYGLLKEKYKATRKPILDAEPMYETITKNFWEENSINNGRFTDTDVRKLAYIQILTGAFGHTYGHQSVWQMYTTGTPEAGPITKKWKEALDDPGAKQMGYIAKLMQSRPIVNRIPNQSIIQDGYAFATKGNGYAFVYLPNGGSVTLKTNTISDNTVTAYWYNPKNGKTIEIDTYSSNQAQTFNAPTNQDMILILDDTSKGYKAP